MTRSIMTRVSDFLWLVLGWIVGIFSPRAICHVAGTVVHLATRRTGVEEHDPASYAIHKAVTIDRLHRFFGLQETRR